MSGSIVSRAVFRLFSGARTRVFLSGRQSFIYLRCRVVVVAVALSAVFRRPLK